MSSLCVGTSMIGGNVMQDDEAALRMLCTAYEEYGINFYVRKRLASFPAIPRSLQLKGPGLRVWVSGFKAWGFDLRVARRTWGSSIPYLTPLTTTAAATAVS